MLARKPSILVFLMLSLSALALFMPISIKDVQAARFTDGLFTGCRQCPGGGGTGQLTQAEIEGLLYMREEEKLARDTYLTLYDKWHLPIFSNISNSEVMHMSRVKDLLDRYGLADPAAGKPVGVFTNSVLQKLYDDLIVQGSRSSIEALRVGVLIEEVDISDLQKYRAQTTKSDIINVYTMLMRGSFNHLNAFNSQLGQ